VRRRLGEQLVTRFERNRVDGKFENICLDDDCRPTSLIRRFDDIYSDERVELLDVLEQSGQGHDADLDLQRRLEFSSTADQRSEQQLLVSIVAVSSISLLVINN